MTAEFNPALIVPVYEHGKAFAAMLPDLLRAGIPVIAVDDGSGGETRDILAALQHDHSMLTVLYHERNQGEGGAVITGLRYADTLGYSHALQIDADGQHDPADISRFLELGALNPGHMIIGRPVFDDSSPLVRRLGRYLTHIWIWIETLSFDISDSMCGFRLYPLEAARSVIDAHRLIGYRQQSPQAALASLPMTLQLRSTDNRNGNGRYLR